MLDAAPRTRKGIGPFTDSWYSHYPKIKYKGDDILSQFTNGADALAALNETNEGSSSNNAEFTPFKTGTTFKIKVIDPKAVQLVYAYSIFKKVNTFVAKNPSVRNAKGFVESNHTPWDKAAEYHYKRSKVARDAESQEAYKYQGKPKFAFAFYDLTQAKFIVIELTKKQAQGIAAVIKKQENKLSKLAFELSKEGEKTDTKVTLTPIVFMDDDLTEKENENFKNAPTEVPVDVFNGIWFEKSEEKMLEDLTLVGFDVSLIGYSKGENSAETEKETLDGPSEDDLPF